MIDIDRLRTVNASGVPLARTTVTELLDTLEQAQKELRNERVITMAAAVIVHNLREAVTDTAVNELHKSLMEHLKLDPVGSGYASRESINGYSEGAEHGTISLASRIKTILDGEA